MPLTEMVVLLKCSGYLSPELNLVKDSHGYFTKDYAGRILFNCLIHGKQIRYLDGEAVDLDAADEPKL